MNTPNPSRLERLGRLLWAAALLLCSTAAPAAEPVALRLIGINDFHGNLEAGTLSLPFTDPQAADKPVRAPERVPVGGAAALAGLVQQLRAGAPHSLMLSAGDLIGASPLVSTLFRHESTIEVMNRIGLDFNAAGNHEFDAGIAELRRVARGGCAPNPPGAALTSCAIAPYPGARFPLLAANVLDARGQPVFAPYLIKRFGAVRVGFIGAVTRSTPQIVVPSGVAGLRFIDEADAVNRAARQLKSRGVHAIVAVFHEGGELGTPQQRGDWNDITCPAAHGPIFEIARRLSPDVGAIFSAHSHQGYRCVVDGRVIIQGTSYGRGVSVIDLAIDPATRRIVPALTRSINLPVFNEHTDPALRERVTATLPAPYADILRAARPDAAIAEQVARYAALAAPKSNQPVGQIGGAFVRGGANSGTRTDSAAGRLIADAQLAATRAAATGAAQMALMNPGGIRSDLDCAAPPCTVTFGQVFTMQPFGNDLVVMTLSGAQIKRLLESQQRSASAEPSFLQPSAGLTYTWQADAPAGERVRELRLNGVELAPEQRYRVTVNSFLAEGGDGYTLLKDGSQRLGGGPDIDALLAALKASPPPEPVPQPRITWAP